jgi:hypothetical protein
MTERLADIPITATVGEFQRLTCLSKRSIWRLLRSGKLASVMICGRRLVIMESYLALIDAQQRLAMPAEVGGMVGE